LSSQSRCDFHKNREFDLYSRPRRSYYRIVVACPYFYPTEKSSTIAWPFPARLPLGAGFAGICRAEAQEVNPTENELRDFCNIGYARGCPRMPKSCSSDGVRFAVARDDGPRIILHYASERQHEPLEVGRLEYDCGSKSWLTHLRDPCLQRQAEIYLAVYLERRPRKTT
jgi:hypothetical protein